MNDPGLLELAHQLMQMRDLPLDPSRPDFVVTDSMGRKWFNPIKFQEGKDVTQES